MKPETLKFARCVAPGVTPRTHGRSAAKGDPPRCGGRLLLCDDGEHMVCLRCEETYFVVERIPHILPESSGDNHYRDPQIVRTYYEAHYGPFIAVTPQLKARLTFPLAHLAKRADGQDPNRVGRGIAPAARRTRARTAALVPVERGAVFGRAGADRNLLSMHVGTLYPVRQCSHNDTRCGMRTRPHDR